MPGSRLVYSTDFGRACPECGQPIAECSCKKKLPGPPSDGIVRVRREVKGRGGKTVTTITGLPPDEDKLRQLAAELKRKCGSGGTVKDGVIIIQGDHRDTAVPLIEKLGYTVKRAGG